MGIPISWLFLIYIYISYIYGDIDDYILPYNIIILPNIYDITNLDSLSNPIRSPASEGAWGSSMWSSKRHLPFGYGLRRKGFWTDVEQTWEINSWGLFHICMYIYYIKKQCTNICISTYVQIYIYIYIIYGSIAMKIPFGMGVIHIHFKPAILMWTTGVLLVLTHCHIYI